MKEIVPEVLRPYFPIITQLVVGVLIFVVGWIAARIAARLIVLAASRRGVDAALGRFLSRVAHHALLIATIIASLGTVGVRTTSLIALLGSVGLAVGLALQGNLSHFASGVVILLIKPYSLGDSVIIAGQTGRVEDIGLFATTIITTGSEQVVIPNGKITADAITNLTVLGRRRGSVEVGVPYGADLARVGEILVACAGGVGGVLEQPPAAVALTGMSGGTFTFTVFFWCKPEDLGDVIQRARRAVYEALTGAGIEIK